MRYTPRQMAMVADDHELYRAGLCKLVRDTLHFEEVIEITSFRDAIARLETDPTISLATFDLTMTGMNGVKSLQLVKRLKPTLPIVVITGAMRREDLLQVLAAGVQGYALKTLGAAELTQGLEAVLDGRLFVPSSLFEAARTLPEAAGEPAEEDTAQLELTPRQRQVVRLIAEGKSNKEIARTLRLAEGTIKVHVNALYRTLSVRNRASAVAAMAQHGLRLASLALPSNLLLLLTSMPAAI